MNKDRIDVSSNSKISMPIFNLLNVFRKTCNSFLLKCYEQEIVLGLVKSICLINLSNDT